MKMILRVFKKSFYSLHFNFNYFFVFIPFLRQFIIFTITCSLTGLNFCALPVFAKTQSYSIHLSSFKKIDNAIKEVSRSKELGRNAFYRYEAVKGKGKYYRVYIGTFNDEHTARKIGSDLKRKGLILYFNPIKIDKNNRAITQVEKKKRPLKFFEKKLKQ